MGLLGMTDLAVAADHVRLGLPEVKFGLFPMQVTSLLQNLAPPARWAGGHRAASRSARPGRWRRAC